MSPALEPISGVNRLPLAAAAIVLAGIFIPGLGPIETAAQAAGPQSFGWLFSIFVFGGATSLFAFFKDTRSIATILGPFALCFALALMEQQTGSSPWHRCAPTILGLSTDAVWTTTFALSFLGNRYRPWAQIGWLASLAMCLIPVAVSGSMVPSILAPISQGSPVSPSWMTLSVFTVKALFLTSIALRVFQPENRLSNPKFSIGAALIWLCFSGFFGKEGWFIPYGEWSILGHTLTRISALTLATLTLRKILLRAIERPWSDEEKAASETSAALLILLLFFIVKWQGIHWSNTDENIYFYAAAATRDGILPYRDYLFAHPPIRVLIPALIFQVFGFSVATAQMIPVLSAAAAGTLLWKALRSQTGAVPALLAMALFLSAAGTLKASTDMTGINMACALALAAVYCSTKGQSARTGLFLALAAGTGMIAIWWAPVFCLISFRKNRAYLLRFLGIFVGGLALIHGAGYALGGTQYIEGVFTYHTMKAPKDPRYEILTLNPIALLGAIPHNFEVLLSGKPFRQFLYYHGDIAWFGGVFTPLLLIFSRFIKDSKEKIPSRNQARKTLESPFTFWLLALFCGMLFLSALREQYSFYWVILLPVFSALSALGLAYGLNWLRRPGSHRLWASILATMLVLPSFALRDYGNRGWPSEIKHAGEYKHFDWKESAPDPILDSLTASLFFKTYRVQGELSSALHHFFWSKKRTFSLAPEIAQTIRENSTPEQTITGASTSTPLIALLAERRLANNQVDTNAKVFKTGLRTEKDFWNATCEDKLSFILATPRSFFTPDRLQSVSRIRPYFRRVKRFSDPRLLHWRDFHMDLLQLRPGVETCRQ